MSAASLPTPDPEPAHEPAGSDADGWALLEALRRRLDDQSAQGRKTQLQVTQLAESIGNLVEGQRRRERSLNLNSFVAYLIFTLLVGAGFYVLYRSRATELVDARDSAQRERDLAVRRADEATTKVTAREQADGRAWEVYQLLESGKRVDAVGKLATLSELPLSRTERAVLAARAHETQVMEVDAALKAAAAAFKAGRFADVVAPLEAALIGEPAGARSSAMHYYLGVAYAKANDLVKAINHLQFAVVADGDHDDARFQLASALDRSGQYARARGEYDRFATAHPQSPFAVFAMRRSGTLARMPAVAPHAVPAQIAPAPGGAAPTTAPGTTPSTVAPGASPTTTGGAAAPTGGAAAPTGGAAAPAGGAALPPATGALTPAKPAAAKPAAAKPVRVWKPMPKKPVAKPAPATPPPTQLDFTQEDPAEAETQSTLPHSTTDRDRDSPRDERPIDAERPRREPSRDTAAIDPKRPRREPPPQIDGEPPRTERAPPSLPSSPAERTPVPGPQQHEPPRAPEAPKTPTPAPVESQPLAQPPHGAPVESPPALGAPVESQPLAQPMLGAALSIITGS